MKFTIPQTLQSEHAALHERLRRATEAGGEVGEAAKTLARLMHPHFVKEDQFALPPLGLLVALARGETNAEMAAVLELTDRLDRGRIYDRDVPALRPAVAALVDAFNRRWT